MLPTNTIGMMARLLLVDVEFVCCGYFDGKFEAMQHRRDAPYNKVQGPECFRDMCRSMHAHLTSFRSKDSPEVFDFLCRLVRYGRRFGRLCAKGADTLHNAA